MKTPIIPAGIWAPAIIAALLSALASGLGIGVKNLYRDNAFVRTAWLSNDWITLLVALPALLLALLYAKRNHRFALLIWPGLMAYLVYNYAFYLFGAAFNKLFLVYVLIIISGLYNLALLWNNVVAQSFRISSGSRWYAMAYLLLIGLMLMLVEVPPILSFLFTGKLPAIIAHTGHPTGIVYALDLIFIVPACMGAVYGLWQNRNWAVPLAAVMLVKGAVYGCVLVGGTLLLAARGVAKDPLLPFYILIAAGGMAGLAALSRCKYKEEQQASKSSPIPDA